MSSPQKGARCLQIPLNVSCTCRPDVVMYQGIGYCDTDCGCHMRSAAVLGYALESFVDVWSSILVLWRFWGDGSNDSAAAMVRREKYASFGISLSVSQSHPKS